MSSRKIDVLGICASPRKGNSLYLLEEALSHISTLHTGNRVSTGLIEFRGKKIAPCKACEACAKKSGECVVEDDFQDIRDQWERADVSCIQSPFFILESRGSSSASSTDLVTLRERSSLSPLRVGSK